MEMGRIWRIASTAAVTTVGLCMIAFPFLKQEETPPPLPPTITSADTDPDRTYIETIRDINADRLALAAKLSSTNRQQVIVMARRRLTTGIRELAKYWYGTPWDFHGTSQQPGVDKIACGYFVTTILRDAGLKIERVHLAQQASERIIKSLTGENQIQRFSNIPIRGFVQAVRKKGDGIYIAGLDSHVGFIVCSDEHVAFIHSSGLKPRCVVDEPALTSKALINSKYRVTGHISADEQLIMHWLNGQEIPLS